MGHGHHVVSTVAPWLTGVAILGLLLLITLSLWAVHRRTRGSDGLSPRERERLSAEERTILSMVRQHGGRMAQTEIIDALPGDMQDLADTINSLTVTV
ncbi:MAG TPA: hypothetical protein ENN80_12130 [Candidatus Hydrogenedentes bacterium]|nr:hypothetical protein [Candidatus Hydrogenedentota bacterium]